MAWGRRSTRSFSRRITVSVALTTLMSAATLVGSGFNSVTPASATPNVSVKPASNLKLKDGFVTAANMVLPNAPVIVSAVAGTFDSNASLVITECSGDYDMLGDHWVGIPAPNLCYSANIVGLSSPLTAAPNGSLAKTPFQVVGGLSTSDPRAVPDGGLYTYPWAPEQGPSQPVPGVNCPPSPTEVAGEQTIPVLDEQDPPPGSPFPYPRDYCIVAVANINGLTSGSGFNLVGFPTEYEPVPVTFASASSTTQQTGTSLFAPDTTTPQNASSCAADANTYYALGAFKGGSCVVSFTYASAFNIASSPEMDLTTAVVAPSSPGRPYIGNSAIYLPCPPGLADGESVAEENRVFHDFDIGRFISSSVQIPNGTGPNGQVVQPRVEGIFNNAKNSNPYGCEEALVDVATTCTDYDNGCPDSSIVLAPQWTLVVLGTFAGNDSVNVNAIDTSNSSCVVKSFDRLNTGLDDMKFLAEANGTFLKTIEIYQTCLTPGHQIQLTLTGAVETHQANRWQPFAATVTNVFGYNDARTAKTGKVTLPDPGPPQVVS